MGEHKSDMEKRAEAFVEQLLTEEAMQKPSDSVKPEELVMELPPWFDEKLFNRGRKFYWTHFFSFFTAMLLGLIAVFAVPSILRILVNTRRSSSAYTAYRRYVSTFLHVLSWFEYELKPGTKSWKSLYTVRSRHLRAGLASRLKGGDTVSQRDVALTQFGFIGFSFLKPDKLGIRQLQDGDWEATNHVWKVIGYMIGLEDRYNICRETAEETRYVCKLLNDRFYKPSLENVPEYFEHMSRVMLDGLWSINPSLDTNAMMYLTRYLADVPGYIYTEQDRIDFQNRIRKLEKKPGAGVDTKDLMPTAHWKAIGDLPNIPPRVFKVQDFANIENTPYYKHLGFKSKLRITMSHLAFTFYSTWVGRIYFNLLMKVNVFIVKYFPFIAFIRFGVKEAIVNIFQEDVTDITKPIPNETYYKQLYKTA